MCNKSHFLNHEAGATLNSITLGFRLWEFNIFIIRIRWWNQKTPIFAADGGLKIEYTLLVIV